MFEHPIQQVKLGNKMTISTKPEDIDSPETILHYMDSYPASGQNRAAAKLIRELLAAAPLVADTTPISNSQLKTMASLLGAAISDAENSGLRNVCIRLKSELLNMIEQPVATTDNAEAESHKRMFMQAIASLSDIDEALGINEDGCGGPEETIFAIEELKQQLADVLAGQVAPQATEGAPFGWLVTFNGCNPQFVTDRTFVEDIAEGGVEIEADIALFDHPTSKADTGEAIADQEILAKWSKSCALTNHAFNMDVTVLHFAKSLIQPFYAATDRAIIKHAKEYCLFDEVRQDYDVLRYECRDDLLNMMRALKSAAPSPIKAATSDAVESLIQQMWDADANKCINPKCRTVTYGGDSDASTIKAEQAPDKHPSELSIAGIARKHFGNPIPPAAYAFASELIAATLATIKEEPTGGQS